MYEKEKTNPEFAAKMIPMMIAAHCLDGAPPMGEERLQKCKYLFKTLCLAAGIKEGLIESFWVAAFHPSLDELEQ